MKMIYKAPQALVIEIQMKNATLLSASEDVTLDDNVDNKITDNGDILVRGNNDWDIWSDDVEYDNEY